MNVVIMSGKVFNDPTRTKAGKGYITKFSVLADCKTKGLFSCEAWGDTGAALAKLSKDDDITFKGSLISNSYEGKDGQKKHYVTVRIQEFSQSSAPTPVQPSETEDQQHKTTEGSFDEIPF